MASREGVDDGSGMKGRGKGEEEVWEECRYSVTPQMLFSLVFTVLLLGFLDVHQACHVRSGGVLYWLPDPLCCPIPIL